MKKQVSEDVNIRALIVGAGETGTKLFHTILGEPGVVLTGIVDAKDEFPSYDLACIRKIPVFADISKALETMPDIVFCLDESGIDSSEILANKPVHTEIVENQGVRFFLNMIHHSRIDTILKIRQGKKEDMGRPTSDKVLDSPGVSTSTTSTFNKVFKSTERKITNILCIDYDEELLESLCSILEPAGYKVIVAQKGWEGMGNALIHQPDLIIFDPAISERDGFHLFQALKSKAETADIPIIILTAKDITVGERLKYAGKIESTMNKIWFSKEDLLAQIHDLEITCPVRTDLLDSVSGLFNKSYFQIRLAQEICRADRHKTVFSILMAHIDGFHDYARVCGMDNYNACILKIADFMRDTSRGSDILVRYGFADFAILLASATEEATHIVARRLLAFIENYHFRGVEELPPEKLTVSIAIVHYDAIGPCAPEKIITEAQKLIREAEKCGKGNIKIYGLTGFSEIDPQLDLVFRHNLGEDI